MSVTSPQRWLAALPHPSGPLQEVQRRGRIRFGNLPVPSRRLEAWRLTNLSRLEALLDLATVPVPLPVLSSWPEPPAKSIQIVLNPFSDPLANIQLPAGVYPLTQAELSRTLGRGLERCACLFDWPVVLNDSAASSLLALRISGRLTTPLEVIVPSFPVCLAATRLLLLLDDEAELDLLQVLVGDSGSAHSHLVEIRLGHNARLNHGWLALGGGDAALLGHLALEQKPYSYYGLTSVHSGWSFGRFEPRIVQVGGRANTCIRGLQVTMGNQQLATHALMRFDGPQGTLDQLQKGLAGGRSHNIFNGTVQVPRLAQLTDAAQLSRNLLLSSYARIDTKPELEIVADDVRCTHGATIGQLQQEELFYLQSRGIAVNQASALLISGYCSEVLSMLPADAASRWRPMDALMQEVSA
ncbi:Fe-S cluster assembly protein SufD [cyanobiont of Ornithocercus magnificus]|nr:Fe-S cluster assembly protein SufD [cyanobiont of Ornithocercus magnificus]